MRGSELPLWIWAAGYLEFQWHTLGPGAVPVGVPTLLAATALLALTARVRFSFWQSELSETLSELRACLHRGEYFFAGSFATLLLITLALFVLGLLAAAKPPFLPQEYDAINYQMGVPRQLLVRGSQAWISWSVADLWPMAMQWGLAPLTSLGSTLNKIPQFLLSIGAFACMIRLTRISWPLEHGKLLSLLPALALFGAHGVMIQLGSGMMDLPALYFLVLCVACLFERRFLVAALALAVYVASKAFHPFQVGAVGAAGIAWLWLSGKPVGISLKRFVLPLMVFSSLLMIRPALVSLAATGTPLFPFLACRFAEGSECTEAKRPRMQEAAHAHLLTAQSYGNGHGPLAFLMHLWRVAVPTTGVNNEFDYPLGLPWLLFLVLAAFAAFRGEWRHPALLLAFAFWGLWWANAHQARWLYPTLAFGLVGTLAQQRRAFRVMPALLVFSSGFSLVSQARALRPALSLSAGEIRERGRAQVQWDAQGRLVGHELLYVDRPAIEKGPGGERWTFR